MQRLTAILDSLPAQWPARAGMAALAVAWRLTAGPVLASQVEPEAWRDGVVYLRAADPGAQRRVASLRPELLRGLNQRLGPGRVKTLQVRVDG